MNNALFAVVSWILLYLFVFFLKVVTAVKGNDKIMLA